MCKIGRNTYPDHLTTERKGMQYVQCSNPKCLKTIPLEIADYFEDTEWFKHYVCTEKKCLVAAILDCEQKIRVTQMFSQALAECG